MPPRLRRGDRDAAGPVGPVFLSAQSQLLGQMAIFKSGPLPLMPTNLTLVEKQCYFANYVALDDSTTVGGIPV